MPVLKGKELRIVGFLCNWCSYGGADTAGVARAGQPTDLRIIRVPCSGRVDPLFIVRALLNGADGVLVSGCHPRDCHYSAGNYYARRRLEVLKHFLPILGIDGERFEYTWVSASEGQRWQTVVTRFTERIHKLGPAPSLEDAPPLLRVPEAPSAAPLHPLGTGKDAPLEELKAKIKASLDGLECVIGWRQGFDALHSAPAFMKSPEDVDKLVWGPLNVTNLAVYLPSFKGRKVGIVVKGCDSRSVVELLQENLIRREDVVIFSMPCEGTLDYERVRAATGDPAKIESAAFDADSIRICADGKEHTLAVRDVALDKCFSCVTPGAVTADERVGHVEPVQSGPARHPELALLESMSLSERLSFWRGHMERCLRCYACRNACPMCVCRDQCVAESRDPHWLTQENTVREKFFFQIIHAMHLAGSCTGCAQCRRACPVCIPILALRRRMEEIVGELFDNYKAGMNASAVPPLLGYEAEERHIRERDWK
jgi:coenzyme F420-reducing hydrogenase delta subunit/ferredoxin